MSKKLSQSEIDALVASLLSGDAPAEDPPVVPDQPVAAAPVETPAPVAVPTQDSPAAVPAEPAPAPQPAATAPVIGLSAGNMPFELVQDLGPISQPEVDAAIATFTQMKSGAPVAPPTPVPTPTAAAATMVAPPPASTTPAPGMAVPPSASTYASGQAQAAQQTRRALSMAAVNGVLMDIELTVTVELGSARLSLGDVLALGPGSVITLEKIANTPVNVLVNRLPMMKADVLAIGEKYGVRITQTALNVKAAS